MAHTTPRGKTAELAGRVVAWLATQEVETYLVGGAVRDRLLQKPVHDLDLVVDGDGLVTARRLADRFAGSYFPLDPVRLVGRAILFTDEGRLVIDLASLRGRDLAADLADRDFTINAMAASVANPEHVIDLHGGLADLAAGVIRPVSELSIRNDPARVLRAVRVAAVLGFSLAPQTVALMRRDGAALAGISGERVRDELARLLAQPASAPWLRLLDDLGLLTVVFPELEAARGETQSPPHHLDVLAHSLAIVAMLESILGVIRSQVRPADEPTSGPSATDPSLAPISQVPAPGFQYPGLHADLEPLAPFAARLVAHLDGPLGHERSRLVTLKLAALLHDVAKPARRGVDEDGRIRFLGHDQAGARVVGAILGRLRFDRLEARIAETIVRHHMRPLLLASQQSVSARAVYRFFRDTGDIGLDIMLHALADQQATYAAGSGGEQRARLVELAARMLGDYWDRGELVLPQPLIGGQDLMATFDLGPGPQVGELLEAVREAQAVGDVRTRAQALDFVRARLSGPTPPRG